MTRHARIAGPFASVLEAERDECNTRVSDAMQSVAAADRDAVLQEFTDVLSDVVTPIVNGMASEGVAVGAAAVGLFDAALSLCTQRRFGALQQEGWSVLFRATGPMLVSQSERLIPAVANALANFERNNPDGATAWIDAMVRAAGTTADAGQWLKTGQVRAWRCGMALYRTSALALAADLPPALLDLAIPGAVGCLDRLVADPWFDPAAGGQRRGWRRVGGFRGFGGPFLRPPLVDFDGDDLVATDGDGWWLLRSDAFGSAVVRADEPGVQGTSADARLVPPARLVEVADVTSWVSRPGQLAATSRLSHHVFIATDPDHEASA